MDGRLKLDLSMKHFFLNLAQAGLSLGVWMTMLDYPIYVWGGLAVIGNVLASFDRAHTYLAQLKKFAELSVWAIALLYTPSELSGWLYPVLAAFNFLEVIFVGLLQARGGGQRSPEPGDNSEVQESSSPGFFRRFVPFGR